jgi:6,7-dimethyl-8-ribityllumazine synthase
MDIEVFQADSSGADLRIAVVQSRFNEPICKKLREACLKELVNQGVDADDIFAFSVPGALELGSALEKLASSKQFDALIAIGAVIRGETYHFEVVSNESASAITRVSQDFSVPVANAVLTADTAEQAQARAEEKGADAARVAIEMANLMDAMEESFSDDDDDDEDDDDYDDDEE